MSPLHPHRQTTNSPFSRSPLPSMTLPSWNFIVPVSPSLSGRQSNLSAFTLFKLWCLSVSEINMVWYWCDSCRIYVHEQLLSTQFVPVCLPWQRLFCEYLLKRAVTHSKRFFFISHGFPYGCVARSFRKRFRASQWDFQKGSKNGSCDLSSSDFEKGDTARRSRTTERSELVSEEAELSGYDIRHLLGAFKKRTLCFYVWLL